MTTDSALSSWLAAQQWLECHVVLRNSFAAAAREHPLLVLDAVLKYAARQGSTRWPPWHFRPDRYFAPKLVLGKRYGLTILFPGCADMATGDAAVASLRSWLADERRHFRLERADSPCVVDGTQALAAVREANPGLETSSGVCLDVLSPLPFKAACGWSGTATADWLGETLVRRVERLFGEMPPSLRLEALQAWQGLRLLPWFWEYEKYQHVSQSTGGVRFCHGFCGRLYLEGAVAPVLPLLAVARHCNVGSRLSAGQGAFAISLPQPERDDALLAVETWIRAWRELAWRTPGLTPDLPEGMYERLCRRYLEADAAPPSPDQRLDMLLGMGLYDVLHTPLSRMAPDMGHQWDRSLPWLPGSGILRTVDALLPTADRHIRRMLARFARCSRPEKPNTPVDNSTEVAPPEAWLSEQDVATPLEAGNNEDAQDNDVTDVTSSHSLRRPCYLLHPGTAVTLDDERICARYAGALVGNVPLGHVSQLVLRGAGSVSIPLLRACDKRGIPVIFCTSSGRFYGLLATESAAWRLRADVQLRHWDRLGEQGRLRMACVLIMAKIRHYAAWLCGAAREPFLRQAAAAALRQLEQATTYGAVLGVEGTFARLCFAVINGLVAHQGFASGSRRPHQRADAWNCLLDAASSLVYNRLCVLLHGEGLPPYRGYLHRQHARYATLAADIQEVFRARTERWLVSLIRQGDLDTSWLAFDLSRHTWNVTREGWPPLLDLFEQALASRRSDESATWLEFMEEQVHRLRLWCMGKMPLTLHAETGWWEPEWQPVPTP